MNTELADRRSFGRPRGLAMLGAALTVLAMFSLEIGSMDLSAWGAVRAVGPATPDQALSALAGLVTLAFALWLMAALLFSLVGAVTAGRSSGRRLGPILPGVPRWLAPLLMRQAVAALLGITIAATPATAEALHPVGPGDRPVAVATSAAPIVVDPDLSPAWAPPRVPFVGPTGRSTGSPSVSTPPSVLSKRTPSSTTPTQAFAPGSSRPNATSAPGVPSTASVTGTPSATSSQSKTPAVSAAPVPNSDLLPGWLPARPVKAGRHARPQVTPAEAGPSTPGTEVAGRSREVVVRRGDTLWAIASRHLGADATVDEVARAWPDWFSANRAVIGADPDHLVPGERLRIPRSTSSSSTSPSGTAPSSTASKGGLR